MKRMLFLLMCNLIFTTAYPKVKFFDPPRSITSLDDLNFEDIQKLIQSKKCDITIELREGAIVPLKFLMKNRNFSAMIDPNLVFRVEKTAYLRLMNKKCYMSEDLVHWEKAGKFTGGLPVFQLKPNATQPGLTLEANIVPYEEIVFDDEDFN